MSSYSELYWTYRIRNILSNKSWPDWVQYQENPYSFAYQGVLCWVFFSHLVTRSEDFSPSFLHQKSSWSTTKNHSLWGFFNTNTYIGTIRAPVFCHGEGEIIQARPPREVCLIRVWKVIYLHLKVLEWSVCELLSPSKLYKNYCTEAKEVAREVRPPFSNYLVLL